jgi:trimethylamine:corrinoid methyltransferase-like protein
MDYQPLPEIRERARESFKKFLNEHQPDPLQKDIQFELQTILKTAEEQDAPG